MLYISASDSYRSRSAALSASLTSYAAVSDCYGQGGLTESYLVEVDGRCEVAGGSVAVRRWRVRQLLLPVHARRDVLIREGKCMAELYVLSVDLLDTRARGAENSTACAGLSSAF